MKQGNNKVVNAVAFAGLLGAAWIVGTNAGHDVVRAAAPTDEVPSPNYELEAQGALQGMGAALLSPVLFAELITQGALVAPFAWMVEGPNSYWLLWAKGSTSTHFVSWMKSQFGASS